mgnify:CR=1 FL=1
MTALTMEQLRHDFEAMLRRADLARATMPPCRTELAETGGPLALIARDVSELCTAWAESAHRARTHKPSDQAQARARIVAARCLQALSERDPDGYLEPILKMIGYTLRGRDLCMDPAERIGWLLSTLGDLGTCYHRNLDPNGSITVFRLRSLTVESLCAALAAERGLWQEEES